MVRATFRIDPEVWKRARMQALAEGITVQKFIARALRYSLGDGNK